MGSPVEAVPGIWDSGDERLGMLCVTSRDEFDVVLEPGVKVAEAHSAAIQTRVCQDCGGIDTDAWLTTGQENLMVRLAMVVELCKVLGLRPADNVGRALISAAW